LAAARAAGAAVLYALAAGTLVSLAGFALTDALFHLMGVPRERSEEHTSELQSRFDLVCRLLLEKKKIEHLSSSGLARRTSSDSEAPRSRVVIEKPLGSDLESAQALNKVVLDRLGEHQVYLIDHS